MENIPQNWLEHDEKVKPYLWSKRALGWTNKLISLAVVIWLLVDFRGKFFDGLVYSSVNSPLLQWWVFFGILGLVFWLIGLPTGILGHRVERQFGLSKQGYGNWFGDQVKGVLVGGVLGGAALTLLFYSQRWFPQSWWFVAATFMLLFSILLAQLAPVLLIPIFFKLKPMEEGPLKKRLLDLCQRYGVEVENVYHLGMGDKTEKGNAAFTGLGRTKRIMIGDTLYERYPEDQVEAVFAHELGHQVNNDLWKGIGFSTGFLYLSFYLSFVLMEGFVGPQLEVFPERPFGMFVFLIVLSLVQIPSGWLQLAWSRYRERLADQFAAKTIGVAMPLADALERLTQQNWGQFRPNPILEWFQYSHPAPWRRITHLRK